MKSAPRIDGYIERAAPFARPILAHLRDLVGTTCPQAEETIKWGFPHFVHRGRILCGMAAFKAHVTFGLWQNRGVTEGDTPANDKERGAKREETRGKRIGTTIARLEEGKRLNWKYERC